MAQGMAVSGAGDSLRGVPQDLQQMRAIMQVEREQEAVFCRAWDAWQHTKDKQLTALQDSVVHLIRQAAFLSQWPRIEFAAAAHGRHSAGAHDWAAALAAAEEAQAELLQCRKDLADRARAVDTLARTATDLTADVRLVASLRHRLAVHAVETQRWRLDSAMWQRECCRVSELLHAQTAATGGVHDATTFAPVVVEPTEAQARAAAMAAADAETRRRTAEFDALLRSLRPDPLAPTTGLPPLPFQPTHPAPTAEDYNQDEGDDDESEGEDSNLDNRSDLDERSVSGDDHARGFGTHGQSGSEAEEEEEEEDSEEDGGDNEADMEPELRHSFQLQSSHAVATSQYAHTQTRTSSQARLSTHTVSARPTSTSPVPRPVTPKAAAAAFLDQRRSPVPPAEGGSPVSVFHASSSMLQV